MLRVLPGLLMLALTIYCLIDCIRTPEDEIQGLPKILWVLLILLFPLVGGVAWLMAGRSRTTRNTSVSWPGTDTAGFPEYERVRPLAPDDDDAYLRRLDREADERRQELLRREEALRPQEPRRQDPHNGPRNQPGDSPTR